MNKSVLISGYKSIDIDSELDFQLVEFLLKKKNA